MSNGNEDTVWQCNFRNCKLERAGPPNQFFFPKQKSLCTSSHPTQPIDKQLPDYDSDVEKQMEADPTTQGVGDPYYIKWDDNFNFQTNAFLLYNFSWSQKGLDEVPKAQFVRELCKEMIENDEYKQAKDKNKNDNDKRSSKRLKRVEEHMLCKLPAGCRKWNGTNFRATSQPYQKYRCSSGCGSMIRTYCLCDKTLMLCNECYSIHKAEFS